MNFIKDNGRELEVVEGFRDRVLNYRKRLTPQADWQKNDFSHAIRKRLKRFNKLLGKISESYANPKEAEILEIGCGDGINTLLLCLYGVKRATGIDLDLRLFNRDEKGEALRRLAQELIKEMDSDESLDRVLETRSIDLVKMDATRMSFGNNSFDIIISRSVLEHILSLDGLFSEIDRVLKPGGIIYHEIDPFYWLRGCHKRGLVDIPWAHARLTLQEYHRFVSETEGERRADKRLKRLETLNRISLEQWRSLIDRSGFEILSWDEITSSFAEIILKEMPEAALNLLPGIGINDLTVRRIQVALKKSAG